jgi:hypothetical protein
MATREKEKKGERNYGTGVVETTVDESVEPVERLRRYGTVL